MDNGDIDRRALIVGVGGAVAAGLIARRASAAPPAGQPVHGMQQVLDKIARTDQGFGECCLPVQAYPGAAGGPAFVLRDAGSYYLNGNVMVPSGGVGILMDGSNMDLDLNGYSVLGQGGGAGLPGGTGIVVHGDNCAIYDGSVARVDVGVDMSGASYSMVWDVTAIDCLVLGFDTGTRNQNYDSEAHRCGTGFRTAHDQSQIQECGAFSCAVGFQIDGTKNLVISNSATDCPSPFALGAGNLWGPVVSGSGNLALIPGGSDVNANIVS